MPPRNVASPQPTSGVCLLVGIRLKHLLDSAEALNISYVLERLMIIGCTRQTLPPLVWLAPSVYDKVAFTVKPLGTFYAVMLAQGRQVFGRLGLRMLCKMFW